MGLIKGIFEFQYGMFPGNEKQVVACHHLLNQHTILIRYVSPGPFYP